MICHITVQTGNMQESIDFYTWLFDMPVITRYETPGGELAFLGAEETKLEFFCRKNYNKQDKIEGISIGFKVDNLEEKIEMLKSKNIGVTPIIAPVQGVRFCFFTDLNGVNVQLFEEK
jgi:lactoylglutathione lyase